MNSLRGRIAITATVVTALALLIASGLLLRGLRISLTDQLDDSVSDQALDYAVNVVDTASLGTIGSLNDLDTLLVIFDEAGGEPWLANDSGVRVAEILDEVPFARSDVAVEPILVDASIESATDTDGSEQMRAAVAPVIFDDFGVDDPLTYVFVGRSTAPIDETVARTRTQLLVGGPGFAALVAGLAWWLTGRALKPVDQLRKDVDHITAGDLGRRVNQPGGAVEIDRLASTMNDMLGRLDAGVKRQQSFVSDAAHELRTPLASMAVQLDVDAAHPHTADHGATVESMRGEIERMRAMIDSMLVLARTDQGQLAVSRTSLVDLDETIRGAVARVARPAAIDVDLRGVTAVEVRGDEGHLHRVFDNLLANAYRHARSRVAVASGVDDDSVWAVVDDDGAGIAPEHRERIFERFTRLDEGRARDAGGSGLGLALARELAHAHGGSLVVADGGLGGARFVLRLPSPTRAQPSQ